MGRIGKDDVAPPQNTKFVRVDIVATTGRSQRLRSPSPLGGVGEGLLLSVGPGGVYRWCMDVARHLPWQNGTHGLPVKIF